MKIGVADTAEQDFDLNVVFGWVSTRNRRGSRGDVALLIGFGA